MRVNVRLRLFPYEVILCVIPIAPFDIALVTALPISAAPKRSIFAKRTVAIKSL